MTGNRVLLIIAAVLIALLGWLAYHRNDGDAGDQFANSLVFWLIVFAVVVDGFVLLARNLRWRS